MTKKSRYFLIASAAALIVGLGGGLAAYLAYQRASSLPAGVPAEMRYVPASAVLVAYADVGAVMKSELRRQLIPTLPMGRRGPQMLHDFAGIDLETQVDHMLAYMEPQDQADAAADKVPGPPQGGPPGVMLIQGSFDQARIEQSIRDGGGVIENRNGHHMAVHENGAEGMAVGFLRPDLLAVGRAPLVRRALESQVPERDLTTNAEMMSLVRDAAGSTVWAAGSFDAVSRRMRLPASVSGQVPPVRLMSAKADIDGGLKVTIRADTADAPAAEQLREVVRGFIALARLQGGSQPQFESALKSIELSGADKTVRLSFALSPDAVRAIAPSRRPPQ